MQKCANSQTRESDFVAPSKRCNLDKEAKQRHEEDLFDVSGRD